MPYHIDDKKVTLDDLKTRIKETDLIPSREKLLDGIDENIVKLQRAGIDTLSDFRKAVKTSKKLHALDAQTAIGIDYLTLLRREAEGYFPKAFPLGDFKWLNSEALARLIGQGYKNSALLYEALETAEKEAVFNTPETDRALADELSSLVSLTRIQWVSPLTAKMLFDAGYKNITAIADADSVKLSAALENVNAANKYFKGKIGLRDVKRLVKAAGYV